MDTQDKAKNSSPTKTQREGVTKDTSVAASKRKGEEEGAQREEEEVAGGRKRGRGQSSSAPPPKTTHVSNKERVVSVSGENPLKEEEEDEEDEEEGDEEAEEVTGSPSKDRSNRHRQELQKKAAAHRPRTRSLSGSDSPSGPYSTKTSPMTRSHAATAKDVEFISLPSRKKRKGRLRGSGSSSSGGRDAPKTPSPTRETTKSESEAGKRQVKVEPPDATPPTPPPPPQPDLSPQAPPPKRKRGRPPKNRKEPPPTSSPQMVPTKAKGGGGRGRAKGAPSGKAGEKKVKGEKVEPAREKGEGEEKEEGKMELEDKAGSSQPKKLQPSVAPPPPQSFSSEPSSTQLEEGGRDKEGGGEELVEDVKTQVGERENMAKDEEEGKEEEKKETSKKVSKSSSSDHSDPRSTEKEDRGKVTTESNETSKGDSVFSPPLANSEPPSTKPSTGRLSVFVSVLSGPNKPAMEETEIQEKENGGAEETQETQLEDVGHDEAKGRHLPQNSYSPTLPYPSNAIPPFPPHSPYSPYPGAYPPHVMYSHYYGGYSPLPPPPPPNVSQSMPGAYIPACPVPNEPMPPFSVTQPLPAATTVGGVRVSILDKTQAHLPALLPYPMQSPGQPHGGQGGEVGQRVYSSSPDSGPPGMDVSRHLPHPHPLSQAYRPGVLPSGGGHYLPHSSYVSVRMDHTGMPFVDWGMHHSLPPHHPKAEEMQKPTKVEPKPEEVPPQPVECPECGRSFKNNKALNGHMRLHGGFDWTKKPFGSSQTVSSSGDSADHNKLSSDGSRQPRKANLKRRNHSRSRSNSPTLDTRKRRRYSNGSGMDAKVDDRDRSVGGEPSVFTFDTSKMHPSHRVMPPPPPLATMHDTGTMTSQEAKGQRNATLDDLCRAVEALEKMENGNKSNGRHSELSEDDDKRRPGNIHIPAHTTSPQMDRERHKLGSTPPYTPPPILSPARSMTMLPTPGTPVGGNCGTPSRIIPTWSSRRANDYRKPSEVEDGYPEPKINIGRQFQAVLPTCDESPSAASHDISRAVKVWQPLDQALEEDESVIDGYLELASSPAVLYGGRNKEYALHLLYHVGGSVKEAVRLLLSGQSVFSSDHPMSHYNYTGSKRWSSRERQQLRRAWRVHRKQFHLLQSAVEGKQLSEVIEYYYSWKKYCSDEYRGRNRHTSEEIVTDDEDVQYLQSTSSSSSDADNSTSTQHSAEHEKEMKLNRSGHKEKLEKLERNFTPLHHPGTSSYDHLPIVYAPHTSRVPQGAPIQQYKCKYPGCTQVFTSIFALNGHIRIHGGSFYPKPDRKEVRSSHNIAMSAPNSHPSSTSLALGVNRSGPSMSGSSIASKGSRPATSMAEYRSAQHLEIARALLDLPQPRSPARGAYNTPSPKPSPGKRSPSNKKKMSSSSPGEHEGYYPCNRCGRVFTKVKSRSAHMKSHIMKQS